MKKLLIIFAFLALVPLSEVGATAYYSDLGNATASSTCAGRNGLATTTSWCGIDQFTEVARSAGDILFVRRGTATTTQMSDVNFTSDGTIANPIIISADYDNL